MTANDTRIPDPLTLLACNLSTTRTFLDDNGGCDCHEGYGGVRCDDVLAWWVTMERARSVFGVAALLILLLWAVLKIAHSFRFGVWKRPWRLVPVATFIVGGGLLVRIASLPIQPRAYGPDVLRAASDAASPYRAMLLAYGVLHGTAVAIVAASFNLLIGFWIDVTTKVRTRMTRRTQIASIVLAVAMALVSGVTIVLTAVLEDASVATVPILLSTLLDTLIVTAIVVYLVAPCCGASRQLLGSAETAKQAATRARWIYMRRCLLAALGAWYLYVLTAALVAPVTGGPGMASYRVVLSYVTLVSELCFYAAILFIIDRDGGILRLAADLRRGERHAGTARSTPLDRSAKPRRSSVPNAISSTTPPPPLATGSTGGTEDRAFASVPGSSSSSADA